MELVPRQGASGVEPVPRHGEPAEWNWCHARGLTEWNWCRARGPMEWTVFSNLRAVTATPEACSHPREYNGSISPEHIPRESILHASSHFNTYGVQ